MTIATASGSTTSTATGTRHASARAARAVLFTDPDTAGFAAEFGAEFTGQFSAPFTAHPAAPDTLSGLVVQLHDVAHRIGQADRSAGAALTALLARLQAHPDPRCTGLVVFASALAERLADANADAANLYLRRFEVPQIELFNLLGRHVPMVRMATRIANGLLAEAIAGDEHPALVDMGIGTGRQFMALIDELAAAGRLPRAMTVVGIEPAADALAQARSGLEAQAARLGFTLQFHGVASTAEAMDDTAWQQVAAACGSAPAVNASFALHHIADDAQGRDQRNRVLARLRALQPRCLVLAEPDVDHLEPRFFERFRHCFAHFFGVFQVLDALPLRQAERDALKVGFFGREIVDILVTPEALRTERHECAASWLQRLAATGFAVQAPDEDTLPPSEHPAMGVAARGRRIALTGQGQPLVSVFHAVPAGRHPA